MAELKVTGKEVVRDLPDNPQEKGGPAKVLKLTLEGDERQPQLFATASTEIPKVVNDADIKWNDQWNRHDLVTKKGGGGGGGGGGFKKSPAETKAIQRQHSQEMALREEANRIAAGQGPFSSDERQVAIDYYEDDIKGKAGTRGMIRHSDVPVDDTDLPFR